MLFRSPAALLQRIEKRIAETRASGGIVRADDDPVVLEKRLVAYNAQTAPLIDYYGKKGALRTVDGMAPINEVGNAIDRILTDGKGVS